MQVRMLAQELGRPPTYGEFNQDFRVPCSTTVVRYFGSWSKFLVAAGFKPRFRRGTADELITQVQTLARKLNKTPTRKEFDEAPETVYSGTACVYFGSWNQFLTKAGLKVNYEKNLAKDVLIAQAQMLANELGKPPTFKEFNEDRRVASASTATSKFGSWNQFLLEAGLGLNQVRNLSKEILIEQVQMLAKKLNRTPTREDFDRDRETASSVTVMKYFGSWGRFLNAAGYEMDYVRTFTKEELIAQIQMLARELNRTPTYDYFDHDPRVASAPTAKRKFGSWNQFLIEAGLKPNKKQNKRIISS